MNRKTHFTERMPLLLIRSIRTDRHMAYTDRYGAGVLHNPLFFSLVISNWCVSIRPLSQLNSHLLLVKLSVLQSFSRS